MLGVDLLSTTLPTAEEITFRKSNLMCAFRRPSRPEEVIEWQPDWRSGCGCGGGGVRMNVCMGVVARRWRLTSIAILAAVIWRTLCSITLVEAK